ncbi:S1/P1 nuclease [Abyssalbus ytuae]|uniref:S1/P1 nuclease n=1 Tax=Abyssalbus ytuae TaxID=2926907 RepID=A0A9E7D192_9FLAO|nr:S1/P1 nuclease [Abyssalbus ytuae]UOB19120.1 S1/P1 nuclease [Abyssalbus ytuae]
MKLINKIVIVLLALNINSIYAWGPTGHRVIGKIATENISGRTKRIIAGLLDNESLAAASTFADEIKADTRYKMFYPWHYVNFEPGQQYNPEKRPTEGDLIFGINKCIDVLKNKNSKREDKVFYLKMLIHFIGDLHQPLHVGKAEDQGGNLIKLHWFKEDSNLHKVWDIDMIEQYNMSYTELADELISGTPKDKIKNYRQGHIMDWVYESKNLAGKVYASVNDNDHISYSYQYEYFPVVKDQLIKGGVRLAKILDEIFG